MLAERRVNSPLSKPSDASGDEPQVILRRLSKIAVVKQAFLRTAFQLFLFDLICAIFKIK
jgi:hypothetical protein